MGDTDTRTQATTTRHREALEAFIARFLCHVPHASGCHAAAFRLARLAGAVPRPGPLDLVPAAWDPHQLARLNPFLSGAAQAKLHDGVLLWLQLCVLEDRLGRLVALAGAGPEYKEQLVQVGGWARIGRVGRRYELGCNYKQGMQLRYACCPHKTRCRTYTRLH